MSAVFQIISHEWRRYIFTRGFLLFLLVIPFSLALGFGAAVLQNATETAKTFVLLDETGRYGEVVDSALSKQRSRADLARWDEFVTGLDASGVIDADELEDPFRPGPRTDQRREAFIEAGGLAKGSQLLSEQAGTELPAIEPGKERFRRVDIEADFLNEPTPVEIGEAYLPYMRGEAEVPGGGRLLGVLYLPEGFGEDMDVEAVYLTDNLADESARNFLAEILTEEIRTTNFVEQGLSEEEVMRIGSLSARIGTVKAGTQATDEEQLRSQIERFLPYGLTYILFVIVLSVGGMMLTNTIEEKSNKIVEMLLSSVSARQLMIGKLLGLALVGLTPAAIFTFIGIAALVGLGQADETAAVFRDVLLASPLVPLFFLYFVLGYLLYASIYLAIGALCESIQDAQSLSTPLTILLFIPLPFIQPIVEDPNGLFARIFTWIPFYTHYALMLRLSGSPPVWEIVGATLVLILTVGLMITFMGRIYRAGILQSGGNANFKAFMAAARAPKEAAVR